MASVLIDTNLLVLLVVGLTSERSIATHKRTQAYDIESFALLKRVIGAFPTTIVTAHILTETSNLIRQCREPDRSKLGRMLATLAGEAEERTVRREVSSRRRHIFGSA